ncbi:MAG: aspartate carbamoyltransferase regulatory subunit [Bacteroidales bacterium]
MNTTKKELEVAALENGTVIDHIPSDVLFKVVRLLGLDNLSNNITIGNNLESKKIGKKGIIKIADKFFHEEEINRIAVIAPNIKLNIIRNYRVEEKKSVELPDTLKGIVKCSNPKCVTNNEPMKTVFKVLDKERITLKCQYCERVMDQEDITLA